MPSWDASPYLVALIVTAAVSFMLALYGWGRRTDRAGAYFALLMLVVAEWAFTQAMEHAVSGLSVKILFAKFQYIAVVSVAPLWLLFALYKGMGEAAQAHLLRTIFLLAAVPGAISLAVIAFWVRDVEAAGGGAPFRFAWSAFSPGYRYYLASLLLFTLGNSTDMFLVLRAVETIQTEHAALARGVMGLAMAPLFWAFFHVCKALATAPLGALSDRVGRKNLIRLGWGVYALVYLGFAFMNRSWQAWPLFAVYALYYGLTEGVEKALVVDLAPPEMKGTAVGMYNLTVGAAALPASVVFGLVYAKAGALAAFGYAGVLAMLAIAVLSAKVRIPRHSAVPR